MEQLWDGTELAHQPQLPGVSRGLREESLPRCDLPAFPQI